MLDSMLQALRRRKLLAAIAVVLLALIPVRFWKASPSSSMLLVTLARKAEGIEASGNAIARVEIGSRPGRLQFLIKDFHEAGTPRISYDGRRAIFAGRRKSEDPTEIWEVSLGGSTARPIVRGGECRDPVYLPDGRIVYARALPGHAAPIALYAALSDGKEMRRITFGDTRARNPAVLPDGRIVFRRHPRGGQGPGRLFTVNPDGTGLQLYCEPVEGASIEGGPWLIEGRLLFAERLSTGAGQRLVSVSTRQPHGAHEVLAGGETALDSAEEWFSSVCRLPQGGLVASAWMKSQGWTLIFFPREVASSEKVLTAALLSGLEQSLLHPTGIACASPRSRPLSLTSVVDESKTTGTLLCLNVYASRIPAVAGAKRGAFRTVRVLGDDGLLIGEAPVEADGSFFIEVPADRPLHLELHGPGGVIARDHSGFWVRPNENRGCIGCHEEPELSPENQVILALTRAATPVGIIQASRR